jgi:hypothetical protein
MNVVRIDPAQLQQIVTLLTEIRDRLPAPTLSRLPPFDHGCARAFGWLVDGSEGPPTIAQFLMAHARMKDLAVSRRPILAAESAAFQLLITAGEQAHPEVAKTAKRVMDDLYGLPPDFVEAGPGKSDLPCPKCGNPRWVAVSLDEGASRHAQCVPCGFIHARLP